MIGGDTRKTDAEASRQASIGVPEQAHVGTCIPDPFAKSGRKAFDSLAFRRHVAPGDFTGLSETDDEWCRHCAAPPSPLLAAARDHRPDGNARANE